MKIKKVLAGTTAAVMALSMLAGCGGDGEKGGVTEVSWYVSGVKQDDGYDTVWNKVNELMEDRYGIRLKMVMTDGDNFSQRIQMMNAAREPYDLVFTSNWANSYYTNVENGSLLDITDKLPELAPKLYASLSEAEIKGASIDGRMYAVPNWQVQARAMGFMIPQEKLDKTGWSMDSFKNFSDLEPYLAKMKAVDPESNTGGGDWQSAMTNYGMITVVQEGLPGVIYYNKQGKPEVVDQFETPEFMEHAKMMRKWVKDGYFPEVRSKNTATNTTKCTTQGSWGNYKPGIEKEITLRSKHEYVAKQISPAVLSTESIISTMTGVGANSKHPDEAIKVLEIMYTDPEIYNMLSWGIEGQNYDKVSDKIIKVKDDNTYTISNWMIGSVANSYILEGNPENIWDTTKDFNDSAVVSPLMGFSLDNSAISAELGNCETVIKEYLDQIQYGLSEPEETVPKLISSLKTAGVDTVLAEVQKQIDEWWESNK